MVLHVFLDVIACKENVLPGFPNKIRLTVAGEAGVNMDHVPGPAEEEFVWPADNATVPLRDMVENTALVNDSTFEVAIQRLALRADRTETANTTSEANSARRTMDSDFLPWEFGLLRLGFPNTTMCIAATAANLSASLWSPELT